MKKILILEEEEVDTLVEVLGNVLDFYKYIFDKEKGSLKDFKFGNLDKLTYKLIKKGVYVDNKETTNDFIVGMYDLCENLPNKEKGKKIATYFDEQF